MPVIEDSDTFDEEYAAYDPSSIRQVEQEPRIERTQPISAETVQALQEDLPSFDDRSKDDFEGLVYLGALVKRVMIAGHRFVLRTLMDEDLYAIGEYLRPYDDSVAFSKAYRAACVAASLVQVDSKKDLPEPYGPDELLVQWVSDRHDMVKKWSPIVLDRLYEHYLEVESRVEDVLNAMGKASG